MQRIMCLSSILVIRYDDNIFKKFHFVLLLSVLVSKILTRLLRNWPLEDVLALAILLLFTVAIVQVRK